MQDLERDLSIDIFRDIFRAKKDFISSFLVNVLSNGHLEKKFTIAAIVRYDIYYILVALSLSKES
jgi:hypothetical protein